MIFHKNCQITKITNNFSWIIDNNTAYFAAAQTGFISFRVRAKNACGDSKWRLMQIQVKDCGTDSYFKL